MLRKVLAPKRENQGQPSIQAMEGGEKVATRPPSGIRNGKENHPEDISLPEDVQRKMHISYDEKTGSYRGISEVLKAAGSRSSTTRRASVEPDTSQTTAAAMKLTTPTKRNPRLKRLNKVFSRKSPVIGSPIQIAHTVHVKVDLRNKYGFTGLPTKWEKLLEDSGIDREEALENPRDLIDVLNYSRGSFPRLLYEDDAESEDELNLANRSAVAVPRSLLFLAEHQEGDFVEEDPYTAFKEMQKIGEGFAGSVFRAIDPLGRDVAVKRIKVGSEEQLEIVRMEVNIMSSINHDCIVACFGSYLWEDVAWISMEYVDGGSLAQLLRELDYNSTGALQEAHIAYIVSQVLRGLEALHQNRCVHRDVKSDNTLLGADGTVKLGDFGFCAELSDGRSKRNSVVGTPCWMAPEVIGGDNYDTKADVWSAGILTLECAEGNPPYYREDPLRAMFMIKTKGPPPLQDPERWSEEFTDFLTKCMAKETTERWTAKQLLSHPFLDTACTRADFCELVQCALEERELEKTRFENESVLDFLNGGSDISEFR
mmetsp:Transcript_28054/g.110301  ORF Transcript_28054/g.110301 Transcript_28054/m.110301 type:complete len:540 (-) Transcript_28054:2553-4172(-)